VQGKNVREPRFLYFKKKMKKDIAYTFLNKKF